MNVKDHKASVTNHTKWACSIIQQHLWVFREAFCASSPRWSWTKTTQGSRSLPQRRVRWLDTDPVYPQFERLYFFCSTTASPLPEILSVLINPLLPTYTTSCTPCSFSSSSSSSFLCSEDPAWVSDVGEMLGIPPESPHSPCSAFWPFHPTSSPWSPPRHHPHPAPGSRLWPSPPLPLACPSPLPCLSRAAHRPTLHVSHRNSPLACSGWRRPHLIQGEDAQPEGKLWQFICQDTVKIEDFSLEETMGLGFSFGFVLEGVIVISSSFLTDLPQRKQKAISILQRQHAGRSKGFAPKQRGRVSKHEHHLIFSMFPSSTFPPIVIFRNNTTAFFFFFQM